MIARFDLDVPRGIFETGVFFLNTYLMGVSAMAEISAAVVKAFRERTGLPLMECKQALVEAQGNEERAIEISSRARRKLATSELTEKPLRPFRNLRWFRQVGWSHGGN